MSGHIPGFTSQLCHVQMWDFGWVVSLYPGCYDSHHPTQRTFWGFSKLMFTKCQGQCPARRHSWVSAYIIENTISSFLVSGIKIFIICTRCPVQEFMQGWVRPACPYRGLSGWLEPQVVGWPGGGATGSWPADPSPNWDGGADRGWGR